MFLLRASCTASMHHYESIWQKEVCAHTQSHGSFAFMCNHDTLSFKHKLDD